MPNSYFQFKQFTVQQDRCAMKVCTDACLFGAWVAKQMQNEKLNIENVLDIGAGTGLLSLMLAQKTNAQIEAVEIDDDSALQARENFHHSPWKERVHIQHSSIQQFNQSTDLFFNIIISNPPFFKDSLQGNNQQKNQAKHTNALSFNELATIAFQRLKEDGKFYILLPPQEFQKFLEVAKEHNLHLMHQVNVRQTENHDYFRTIGVFTKQPPVIAKTEEIIIKIGKDYSQQFVGLLQAYYLHL